MATPTDRRLVFDSQDKAVLEEFRFSVRPRNPPWRFCFSMARPFFSQSWRKVDAFCIKCSVPTLFRIFEESTDTHSSGKSYFATNACESNSHRIRSIFERGTGALYDPSFKPSKLFSPQPDPLGRLLHGYEFYQSRHPSASPARSMNEQHGASANTAVK